MKTEVAGDDYLDRLRQSKSKSSVILLEFITLRSKIGDNAIFVFEGVDDKLVYSQWIRRCPRAPEYEPFVCNNKEQVLRLHNSVASNMAGLNQGVLFFIDRDFDDMKGYAGSNLLFMTEMYAVENYLVCSQVIDDVLKNEFPCHGHPQLRQDIIRIYDRLYDDFLLHMDDFNFHIYSGRLSEIEFRGHIPDSLTSFVDIQSQSVNLKAYDPREILPLMDSVDANLSYALRIKFSSLDRRMRHRGKFAYNFLVKWLHALAEEFKDKDSALFSSVDRSRNVRVGDLVLSNLASKSPIPHGLCNFVSSMA